MRDAEEESGGSRDVRENRNPVFAHSAPARSWTAWETLHAHADRVAGRAAGFAAPFGWAQAASAAGLLHDIGKCSEAFQAYIREPDRQSRGPDHSTAGAREALAAYPGPLGRMLAFIIAGHHAGLADGVDLEPRLSRKEIPSYAGWREEIASLPPLKGLAPMRRGRESSHAGFSYAFLTRMLFSCLVDADFLETEGFYAELEGRDPGREGFTPLPVLKDRLTAFMQAKRAGSGMTELNALRARILEHAVERAALEPGLFTLTVPTGGGKTLASLSFALEHAVQHGLRRVVYVIPFTSIIEQTAEVFRAALAEKPDGHNDADVLEHHATFDWDAAVRSAREDGRGADTAERLRRAAENWAAPVVVATAVQFFESLFANRTSRCRRLHNLAGSVIVLDEAQTLPPHLLRPCMAALDELCGNYGASVVLCTATQPALRTMDKALPRVGGRPIGFDIDDTRELAPDPKDLYTKLKRVRVERREAVTDAEIAARFSEAPQMLCIVNTRAHAQALYGLIREMPGAVHLSTLMCPAHRRTVLAEARARLARRQPVRIVSTSLVEAGVDIDFPEVWRAAAGIDSVAQAAGRCNREGLLDGFGRVVVFEPVEGRSPPGLEQAWQAGRTVIRLKAEDPLGLEAVREYFSELYFQKGLQALDAATLDGETFRILDEIAARAPQRGEADPKLAFPFESIAKAFRLIDDVMEPLIVPWRSGPEDTTAEDVLRRIGRMDQPLGPDLRKLQQYVVSVPKKTQQRWLAEGVIVPVHPALGEALLRFPDRSRYDEATGLNLEEPQFRGRRAT